MNLEECLRVAGFVSVDGHYRYQNEASKYLSVDAYLAGDSIKVVIPVGRGYGPFPGLPNPLDETELYTLEFQLAFELGKMLSLKVSSEGGQCYFQLSGENEQIKKQLETARDAIIRMIQFGANKSLAETIVKGKSEQSRIHRAGLNSVLSWFNSFYQNAS